MTLRHFALKNIRGKWHQYTAYFLSSAFTVMIFYIYAAFIFHPDVASGDLHQGVRLLMVACEWIIVVFSFFFVMYSNSAFLKSRKQEFGLLSLFGMTQSQLKRLVFYENTIISILSIATGIALGVVFSKLFFIAIGILLDLTEPIPFAISGVSLSVTFISFFVLFEVMTLISLFGVGRSRIIDLLKAAKKPKSLPVFSKWLVLVCVLCLGGGYALAWFSGMAILITMFPILILTIVGTYFLFTQGSVAILRIMQRNKSFLYKRTNLLTVSQLVFKMKDNARVLFLVAVMSAVVLTASGTLYTFYQGITDEIVKTTPHTISFTEQGLDRHDIVKPEMVEQILNEHNVKIAHRDRVVGIAGKVVEKADRVAGDSPLIISNNAYNELANNRKELHSLKVKPGEAVIVNPFAKMNRSEPVLSEMKVQAGREELTLKPSQLQSDAVLNQDPRVFTVLVINDKQFEQLAEHIPDDDKIVSYGYELENWTKTRAAVDAVQTQIPDEQVQYFTNRVAPYVDTKQIFALTLFVGVFVSFLFFVAAGSMLYFKLFTEFEEDRAQFKALKRIGMTDKEMKKISTTQIGLIFFLPFVVGVVHAGFALKTLGDVLLVPVWKYGVVVVSIYFAMQLFYFLLSRRTYLKQMAKS